MKKITLIFVLIASNLSYGQQLGAYFGFSIFHIPNETSFVETYVSILGETIKYKENNNTKQGKVKIEYNIYQGEKQVFKDSYYLLSPEIKQEEEKTNFIDQQRIALPNGEYKLHVSISDANNNISPYEYKTDLNINFSSQKINFSDVQFIEKYSKNKQKNILNKSGYNLVPFVSDFLNESFQELIFYNEIYFTDIQLGKEQDLLIKYFIESYEDKIILSSSNRFKRIKSSSVIPILDKISIKNLYTGNYNLVIEVRDTKNNLLAEKRKFFYRINNINFSNQDISDIDGTFVDLFSREELTSFVDYLYPIANSTESRIINNQIKNQDKINMQRFLYNFWLKRNPSNPNYAFRKYIENVQYVNEEFSFGNIPGYKTDRGRVYLQYGAPNSRVKENFQKNTKPFEVWHYYKIGNESNRRFVFSSKYTGMNDMKLVLSNVKGENSDNEWLMKFGENYNKNIDLQSPMDYFLNPQ